MACSYQSQSWQQVAREKACFPPSFQCGPHGWHGLNDLSVCGLSLGRPPQPAGQRGRKHETGEGGGGWLAREAAGVGVGVVLMLLGWVEGQLEAVLLVGQEKPLALKDKKDSAWDAAGSQGAMITQKVSSHRLKRQARPNTRICHQHMHT